MLTTVLFFHLGGGGIILGSGGPSEPVYHLLAVWYQGISDDSQTIFEH